MLVSIGLRCLQWLNVMSVCWVVRTNDIIMTVILEPELLVNCIEPEVWGMRKVEVHQIMAVHQARGIQGHSSLECYTHQAPLPNISRANRVGYEEEFIWTGYDLLSQDSGRRNCWGWVFGCQGWWSCIEAWWRICRIANKMCIEFLAKWPRIWKEVLVELG